MASNQNIWIPQTVPGYNQMMYKTLFAGNGFHKETDLKSVVFIE